MSTPNDGGHTIPLETGSRVQMTALGYKQKLQGRLNRWKGTVTNTRRWPFIGVRRDGSTHSESWHHQFWEPYEHRKDFLATPPMLAARATKDGGGNPARKED